MPQPLFVSELVRLKAAQQGDAGRQWLDDLPTAVAELAAKWDLVVGRSLRGGSEAYVAEATRLDGTEAVLKLQFPGGPDFETTACVLQAAHGDGYVRLLAHDSEHRALLLERLGPSLARSAFPLQAQLRVLCTLLERAWRLELTVELERGDEKAHGLASFISGAWQDLGRPCSRRAVDRALAFADSRGRAFDVAKAVVVHGDAHPENALAHERGFKLVDPECFLCEPAYDLGVCLRDWSAELLAGDAPAEAKKLCHFLAPLTGVPAPAIWEWAFVERVSTGLFCVQLGAEETGRAMLAVADLIAETTYP